MVALPSLVSLSSVTGHGRRTIFAKLQVVLVLHWSGRNSKYQWGHNSLFPKGRAGTHWEPQCKGLLGDVAHGHSRGGLELKNSLLQSLFAPREKKERGESREAGCFPLERENICHLACFGWSGCSFLTCSAKDFPHGHAPAFGPFLSDSGAAHAYNPSEAKATLYCCCMQPPPKCLSGEGRSLCREGRVRHRWCTRGSS